MKRNDSLVKLISGSILFVVLVALGLLTGCTTDPIATTATNNQQVPVSKLFDHDGCTVYRFSSDGRYHYFAKCKRDDVSTSTHQRCGKNCTYDEEIKTEAAQ